MSFQPSTKAILQTAVDLWISDNATALTNHGDINTWDTSLITDMSSLFKDKSTFNSDISNWNTSLVTRMDRMFSKAEVFNQIISENTPADGITRWDVSNVTTIFEMFSQAYLFNNGTASSLTWTLNTTNSLTFHSLFYRCYALNVDLLAPGGGNWNTSMVTNMNYVFREAPLFDQDITGWNINNVVTISNMFASATAMHSSYGSNSNFANTPNPFFFTSYALPTLPAINYPFTSPTHLKIAVFNHLYSGQGAQAALPNVPPNINDWEFDSSLTDFTRIFSNNYYGNLGTTSSLIKLNTTGLSVDISNWTVTYATNMYAMFNNATAFTGDISAWDTQNVTKFEGMFVSCSNFNGNISGWDVGSGVDFYNFLYSATSFNQDLSSWDVSNATRMQSMFSNCYIFESDLSSWEVSSCTKFDTMFNACKQFTGGSPGLSNWDVSQGKSYGQMFADAESFNQDISSWDVTNGTYFWGMFRWTEVFDQYIRVWNIESPDNIGYMFNAATTMESKYGTYDSSLGGASYADFTSVGTPTYEFFNQPAPSSGGASGDPHVKCLNGTEYDFRYHGYMRLLETSNTIVNAKCAPGMNQQSKMEYFTHAYIKHNGEEAVLKLGWRGEPVTILENSGLDFKEKKLTFSGKAKRHCETCRGWASSNDQKCDAHMEKYGHTVTELARNALELKIDGATLVFQNVNDHNGQPCGITIKGKPKGASAGLIAGAEWADASELTDLKEDASLLTMVSKTV